MKVGCCGAFSIVICMHVSNYLIKSKNVFTVCVRPAGILYFYFKQQSEFLSCSFYAYRYVSTAKTVRCRLFAVRRSASLRRYGVVHQLRSQFLVRSLSFSSLQGKILRKHSIHWLPRLSIHPAIHSLMEWTHVSVIFIHRL